MNRAPFPRGALRIKSLQAYEGSVIVVMFVDIVIALSPVPVVTPFVALLIVLLLLLSLLSSFHGKHLFHFQLDHCEFVTVVP